MACGYLLLPYDMFKCENTEWGYLCLWRDQIFIRLVFSTNHVLYILPKTEKSFTSKGNLTYLRQNSECSKWPVRTFAVCNHILPANCTELHGLDSVWVVVSDSPESFLFRVLDCNLSPTPSLQFAVHRLHGPHSSHLSSAKCSNTCHLG